GRWTPRSRPASATGRPDRSRLPTGRSAMSTVRVSELVPRPVHVPRLAGAAVGTAASLAAAAATDAVPYAWATVVLLAVSAVAEWVLDDDGFARWARRRVGAGTA